MKQYSIFASIIAVAVVFMSVLRVYRLEQEAEELRRLCERTMETMRSIQDDDTRIRRDSNLLVWRLCGGHSLIWPGQAMRDADAELDPMYIDLDNGRRQTVPTTRPYLDWEN